MNGEVMETLFDKFYELMRFMITISIALTIFLFVVIFFAALLRNRHIQLDPVRITHTAVINNLKLLDINNY